MSDIVAGLRRLPEPQCRPCYAAADEIERLERLVRLQDAEICRLRLAVERQSDGGEPTPEQVRLFTERLLAEPSLPARFYP